MAYGFEKTLGLTNSHSVFLARLNAASFPTAAIDGSANSIANGGGNLVVYADSSRTTRLPVYVSKFVTGVAPEIAVYVRVPNASPATVLYIEASDAQAVQPAVDAAFGAHACFQDYYLYAPLDSLAPIDLSGNHTLTATGVTTLRPAPFGGECIEFDGANFVEVDGGVTPIADHLYTLGCDVENDELPAQFRLIAGVNNNPNGHLLAAQASAWPTSTPNTYTFNADVSGGSTYINASGNIITAGAKHSINCAHIWTSRDLYINGASEGSVTASITHDATTGPFRIGRDHQDGSVGFVGGIANVRVHKSKISTEYDSDEYANLSAVDSWGAVGTWENNTTNVSPIDIAISNDTITLSAGANAVVGALTVTDPDAGDTHTITTTSADFSVSGTNLICLDPASLGAGSYDVELTADDGVSAPYVETITINIVYDVTLLSVISHAGSGTIAPNSGLSLIVDDSTDVTGVTVGGVAATGMVKDAGGTLIDVVTPLNVNAKIGDSVDIVLVISSGVTNTVSATVVDPAGFQSVGSTVDYAGLPTESFMYGNAAFSAFDVGYQLVIEQQTADLYNVVVTTDMVVTLEAGTPVGSYDIDYYWIDNDGVASTPIGTLTLVIDSRPIVTLSTISNIQTAPFVVTATISETVTDDSPVLTVSSGTVGAISGTGTSRQWTVTPPADSNGVITITVAPDSFLDGGSNGNLISNQISVTYDTRGNAAPTLVSSIPNQVGTIGGSFSLDISVRFSDADGDTLTYSVSSGQLPSGLSLNANSGVVSGTFDTVQSLTGIVISAFDGQATTPSNSFSFVVNDFANEGPAFDGPAIDNQTNAVGDDVSLNISGLFSDPEGDTLSFSVSSGQLPGGLTLNGTSGVISGTLTTAQTLSAITIDASDGQYSVSSNSFSWDVNAVADVIGPVLATPVVTATYNSLTVTTTSNEKGFVALIAQVGQPTDNEFDAVMTAISANIEFSKTLSSLSVDTAFTLWLQAKDSAGNRTTLQLSGSTDPYLVPVRTLVDAVDDDAGTGFETPRYSQFADGDWPYGVDFSDQATKRSTTLASAVWECVGPGDLTISNIQVEGNKTYAVISGAVAGLAYIKVTGTYANGQDRVRYFKVTIKDYTLQ